VATSDGLVRFDGVKFTVFNSGNAEGLASNRTHFLCEDDLGALWIGTEDGGIVRYYDGQFRTVLSIRDMPNKAVLGIYKDTDDGVLVLTNATLFHFSIDGSDNFAPKIVDMQGVYYRREKDCMWHLADSRVRVLKDGVWKSHLVPEGLKLAEINSVHQDREGG